MPVLNGQSFSGLWLVIRRRIPQNVVAIKEGAQRKVSFGRCHRVGSWKLEAQRYTAAGERRIPTLVFQMRLFVLTVPVKMQERQVSNSATRLAWVIIPFISGCQTGTPLDEYLPSGPPTVSGFPAAPPRNIKSVVVWGNDERIVDAASLWVKEHGLTVMGRSRLHEVVMKNASAEPLQLIDEETVIAAASEVGADAVVFSDRVGDVRPPMVTIKGVDTRNNRVMWSGDARYDSFDGLPNAETLSTLTDHALATAWGLAPKED
jgi:hypothetical protein